MAKLSALLTFSKRSPVDKGESRKGAASRRQAVPLSRSALLTARNPERPNTANPRSPGGSARPPRRPPVGPRGPQGFGVPRGSGRTSRVGTPRRGASRRPRPRRRRAAARCCVRRCTWPQRGSAAGPRGSSTSPWPALRTIGVDDDLHGDALLPLLVARWSLHPVSWCACDAVAVFSALAYCLGDEEGSGQRPLAPLRRRDHVSFAPR